MSLFALLLLAAAAPDPKRANPLVQGLEGFDLREVKASDCSGSTAEEIVVCGRRSKTMDIVIKDAARFQVRPPEMHATLPFGGTLSGNKLRWKF